jgi:hypothetical protein
VSGQRHAADQASTGTKRDPALISAKCAAEIPMWEWGTIRDAHGCSVGLASSEHDAMTALSKALIAGGRPSSGRVAEVRLIRPAHAEPTYLRGFPGRTAVYDGTAIRWL